MRPDHATPSPFALRLSRRIGLYALLATLVVASLTAYLFDRRHLEQAAQEEAAALESEASLIAERLQRRLELLRQDTHFIARLPGTERLVEAVANAGLDPVDGTPAARWRTRLSELLLHLLEQRRHYFQARLIGVAKEGRELVRVERRDDRTVVVPDRALQQKGERPYFQSALQAGPDTVLLSPVELNREHGALERPYRPTLRAATPLHTQAGAPFGVVVVNADIGPLFAALSQSLSADTTLYIVNSDGEYLLHPDAGRTFGFDTGESHRIQMHAPALAPLFAGDRDINTRTFQTDENSTLHFRRLHFDSAAPERYLGIVLERRSAPAALQQTRRMGAVTIFTAALLLSLLVIVLIHRLLRPLDALAAAAERVANGDYDTPLPPVKSTELRILRNALQHTATAVQEREQHLRHLNDSLEARVAERTGALNELTNRLQAREASLSAAQRIAHLGSWEWEITTGTLFWSDEIYRIFGLQPGAFEPTYEAFLERVHPQDRARLESAVAGALEGANYRVEHRIVRPDETLRYVEEQGEVIFDTEKRPQRMQGTVLDITERRTVEERLRLLAQVFEYSIQGIVITDPEMHILEVNPAFTQITGYPPEEALGRTPELLSSGWHDTNFYAGMFAALRESGIWQGEVWDRRRDGALYVEYLTIVATHDAAGDVTHYIGVFSDITESKQAQRDVERLAYYDTLTGLANRRLFEDRLERGIARARRSSQPLAVLFIDLDRFKPINDSLGHKAGDRLLIQVGERLRDCTRASDTAARLGGDEFAIVIENSGAPQATHLAEKIVTRLGHPFHLEGHEVFIGASVGISLYPEDGADADALSKHADVAMYRAKHLGRNTFQFFAPEMTAGAEERLQMESELRHAIERGELRLYYQPQVDLREGRIVGAEALVRWEHPERGLIPPDHFIPLAEESGLITPLGEWVMQEACRQRRLWQEMAPEEFRVAVNLSPRQFHGNVVEMVQQALDTTGVPAHQMGLELTESMLMHDPETVRRILAELHELGVELAIDDFGTGYSSLAYLKRFPIDKLKVDRSFIRDLPDDEDDAAITRAVLAMAHSLRVGVVAEGVETVAQIHFLREHHCEVAQGYHCSPPCPAAQFTTLLEQGLCPLKQKEGGR